MAQLFSPAAALPLSPFVVLRLRLRQALIRLRCAPARRGRYLRLPSKDRLQGDLLAEAWYLHGSGYHTAAAFQSRCAIERRLRTLTVLSRQGDAFTCKSISNAAGRLLNNRIITREEFDQIKAFSRRVNGPSHGDLIGATQAAELLGRANMVRQIVDKATVRFLLDGGAPSRHVEKEGGVECQA